MEFRVSDLLAGQGTNTDRLPLGTQPRDCKGSKKTLGDFIGPFKEFFFFVLRILSLRVAVLGLFFTVFSPSVGGRWEGAWTDQRAAEMAALWPSGPA